MRINRMKSRKRKIKRKSTLSIRTIRLMHKFSREVIGVLLHFYKKSIQMQMFFYMYTSTFCFSILSCNSTHLFTVT